MTKEFHRIEEQEKAIALMSSTPHNAALNGSGTGQGKTVMALRTAQNRGAKRMLVIAPPNTFENWASTAEAIGAGQLMFCGNAKLGSVSAAEAKENMQKAQAGENGWFFVGREMFNKQNWNKIELTERDGSPKIDPKTGKQKTSSRRKDVWHSVSPYDVAIFDEIQICSNRANKIAQSWDRLKADFKMAQSADWFGSSLENQWTVAKQLWPEWMNLNQAEWIDEYMNTEYDHFAYTKKKVTSEKWPGFFASTLPCYVALPAAVEKPEPERRYVDLTAPQRKLYAQIEDSMVAEVEGNYLVIELPMHLRMRLLELSLGMFGTDQVEVDGEVKTTIRFDEGAPSSKLDEAKAIMRDYPGEHFIFLTHSQKFAEKAAKDLGGLPYTGKQSDKQKEENKQAFLDGKVKVLVGTSAMAEGLDGLQTVCRNAIILSRPDVSYKTEQFLGRIARRGQARQVNAWEIVARDTLDVGVLSEKIKKALMLNQAKSIQMKESA
jgi:hypothetical protein